MTEITLTDRKMVRIKGETIVLEAGKHEVSPEVAAELGVKPKSAPKPKPTEAQKIKAKALAICRGFLR